VTLQDKPVEGVQTDVRSHPAGAKGAKISLEECATRAWKARMSPRLRAWVMKILDEGGVSTGSRRQKGAAVLEAFRKKVPYVADPVLGEFMATPDQTLCLDDGGLCFIGGDCDDAAITLSACMMSLGIPTMIVGSSHKDPPDVPTHVFMAFQDELENWIRMDGTTKHPVGRAPPRLREWWIEPGKDQKESGVGDFVGMTEKHEKPAEGSLQGTGDAFDLRFGGLLLR
jgi:hypothetical protein